ncbi:uncharacterized protein STEHIDRAFT_100512 [Stereum hirsutum FP-91666 SS1]|uniref:uncharacterized protein n=1 Tax=Stereum hirsutum (strain FP-91666) TaxID=721885 RepID=UPI0004449DD3|nr:uncharacterized protein STEHIDRAFT_100512 [Stereum hirsutum FP-91666 SS1]EIM84459.1 hypothetical protein STEHIDRAFT_100512 [Stereum hirsutum FP-91666 SS1]
MVRNAGKYGKAKRGGGRSFSRNLSLDENGTAVSMDKRRGEQSSSEDDSDEIEEESEEEESSEEEDAAGGSAAAQPELTRAERKALKQKQGPKTKAKKEKKDGEDEEGEEGEGGDDDVLVNPNHVTKKMNISDLNEPRQLSRKEREEKEKKEAKDRYWKLHVQGKTDEAKTDLARLAKIRQEREAAQAKRKAEAEGQYSVITTYPSPYPTLLADCSYSMSRESKGSRNQEDAADKALNVGVIPSHPWV